MGYLVGAYVREDGSSYEKLAKVLLLGTTMIFIAYIWDPVFPINKKIWTSSFVMLTNGILCNILAIVIFLMEKSKWKLEFNVFNTFGKNPLFIYILSGLITKTLFIIKIGGSSLYYLTYVHVFSWIPGKLSSLLFALMVTTICWSVGRWLENRNIYIKI